MLRMWLWWSSRSRMAEAMTVSPSNSPHSPKPLVALRSGGTVSSSVSLASSCSLHPVPVGERLHPPRPTLPPLLGQSVVRCLRRSRNRNRPRRKRRAIALQRRERGTEFPNSRPSASSPGSSRISSISAVLRVTPITWASRRLSESSTTPSTGGRRGETSRCRPKMRGRPKTCGVSKQ